MKANILALKYMQVKSNLFSWRGFFWAVEILFENAINIKPIHPGNTRALEGNEDFSSVDDL